ncbi:protein-glutamate methylesterase/protein-glutamine glutaminase [Anaerobium acetethylicum]|uniref:Protein-glutamate methylesterase/protein-glutamine glutaminase n=1 Tax=Anaerobium acetethylicum TaxID=1619234 RepID=A0A1D3TQK7_9FIRM|nr:chemotaxis response regulator protein-glutamate methylesterase [Anaerobium acetethylicum]SCP95908.1 two-component system, chemotaxis family, response regulator CheB [Anaerobium acetethylicum]
MKKNILIVDDSALMRRVMSDIVESDKRFRTADMAKDGLEAFELLIEKEYDAVLLDINMPRMTGLELLEQLQKNKMKARIVMVSTLTREGAAETIRALELGAFDFVTKPGNYLEARGIGFKQALLEMLAAAVMPRSGEKSQEPVCRKTVRALKDTEVSRNTAEAGGSRVVALACSTGGPRSLQSVLPLIPADIDAGILIVQHMPPGFTNSLALRLNEMSRIRVKEAEDGEMIENGCAYIAPGGMHMKIARDGMKRHRVLLTKDAPVGGLRPCANLMYESLLDCGFDEIICVVMTGMGSDGTEGIRRLSTGKSTYVIAQDEATSVVYGMPKAIADACLADAVVPLDKLSESIMKNVGVHENGC